jgi:hypothetical protein
MDIRGVYRFSSLVKQKIKGENYAVFCFAGKRKVFFIYFYDVITWGKKKSSANHYSPADAGCGGYQIRNCSEVLSLQRHNTGLVTGVPSCRTRV